MSIMNGAFDVSQNSVQIPLHQRRIARSARRAEEIRAAAFAKTSFFFCFNCPKCSSCLGELL